MAEGMVVQGVRAVAWGAVAHQEVAMEPVDVMGGEEEAMGVAVVAMETVEEMGVEGEAAGAAVVVTERAASEVMVGMVDAAVTVASAVVPEAVVAEEETT